MIDWIEALQCLLAVQAEVIMVTVASTRGSAPREPGARMFVGANAVEGTIGGGHLEFEAIRIARGALAGPRERGNWLVRFPLAARLGQCCGGVASLLFQPVGREAAWLRDAKRLRISGVPFALVTNVGGDTGDSQIVAAEATGDDLPDDIRTRARGIASQPTAQPVLVSHHEHTYFVERVVANDFRIVLFGNGHVGRALVQILGTLSCVVTWVDQREHAFPALVAPNVTIVATDDPGDGVREAEPDSMFLVMTHSHALDFELTEAILARGDFRYFGLIGSTSKRSQFERRLAARGFASVSTHRMTCPIGNGAIRSKQPGAIAVAVAAQLLALRESSAAGVDRIGESGISTEQWPPPVLRGN